jgi:hypothetical protein
MNGQSVTLKTVKREYILTPHIYGHMALVLYRLVLRENIGVFCILKMCNESLDIHVWKYFYLLCVGIPYQGNPKTVNQ